MSWCLKAPAVPAVLDHCRYVGEADSWGMGREEDVVVGRQGNGGGGLGIHGGFGA